MKFVGQSLALVYCSLLSAFSMQTEFQQFLAELLDNAQNVCVEKIPAGDSPLSVKSFSAALIGLDPLDLGIVAAEDQQLSDELARSYTVSKNSASVSGVLGNELVRFSFARSLDSCRQVLLSFAGVPISILALRRREDRAGSPENMGERVYIQARVSMERPRLNVHEYPIATSRVLRSLDSGSALSLTGKCNNDWLEVVDGGWVFSHYLEFTNTVGRLPN